MKKVMFAMAVIAAVSFTSQAHANTGNDKNSKHKMEMKAHVCTAACKDGKHVYAHGEKGHTCTAECHKKM